MHINTKDCYIVIGTEVGADYELKNPLYLPVPIELPSSDEFMVQAERNANGAIMLEQVGRVQYTTSIKWGNLPAKKWWEINRWFAEHGYVFYMKYFSHTDGRVKIQRFYRGNINKGVPSPNTEIIKGYAVPKSYSGCGFSIIDMGEEDVLIISDLAV